MTAQQQAYDLITGLISLVVAAPFIKQILILILIISFFRWAVGRTRRASTLYGEDLTYRTYDDTRDAWEDRRAAYRRAYHDGDRRGP